MRLLRLVIERLVERVDVEELVDLLLEYLIKLIGIDDLVDRLADDDTLEKYESE